RVVTELHRLVREDRPACKNQGGVGTLDARALRETGPGESAESLLRDRFEALAGASEPWTPYALCFRVLWLFFLSHVNQHHCEYSNANSEHCEHCQPFKNERHIKCGRAEAFALLRSVAQP